MKVPSAHCCFNVCLMVTVNALSWVTVTALIVSCTIQVGESRSSCPAQEERRKREIPHSRCHLQLGDAQSTKEEPGTGSTQLEFWTPSPEYHHTFYQVISKVHKRFQQINYEYQVKVFQVNHTKTLLPNKTLKHLKLQIKSFDGQDTIEICLISFWISL